MLPPFPPQRPLNQLRTRGVGARVGHDARAPMPTVIHWARFELTFLRAQNEAHGAGTPFPFDVVCLHAVCARLFPELPRRSLRALAGHLEASPQMVRRAAGHVDVSAFVWRALVPRHPGRGQRREAHAGDASLHVGGHELRFRR